MKIRSVEYGGMFPEAVADVLRVVSPLELPCQVPREHRAIFAGTADRLIPADQVQDLWQHWEEPAIHWYHGAHMTFAVAPAVGRLIDGTLRGAELI